MATAIWTRLRCRCCSSGVPEAKTGQNRVHLDLATRSAAHQAAEVKRLLGLGAVPADIGQGDVPWVVLADPEGNEFCVLEPRAVYRDTGPVAAVVASCRDPVAPWPGSGGWPPAGCRATHSAPPARPAAGYRCGPRRASGPYLELLPAAEPKAVKNRIHLDVAPFPGDDQAAEVAALRAAGAAPAGVGQGAARGSCWLIPRAASSAC